MGVLRRSALFFVLLMCGCDGRLLSVTPEPGETGASPHVSVEASFAHPPGNPDLRLFHPWGSPVTGTAELEERGRTVVFEPTHPLQAGDTYVARLSWSGEDRPTTWRFQVAGGLHAEYQNPTNGPGDPESAILDTCRPAVSCFSPSQLRPPPRR